jgi:aryl sulfotransferase
MAALPERTRIYQNHHLDSTRWDHFVPRPDDIVVATPYKAGTTWTQAIVANLIFGAGGLPAPLADLSPWIDNRVRPVADVMALIEAQTHRRFIKCHLNLDGLRLFPELKYIFISRDGRDVFMSMWNHYSNYVDAHYDRVNNTPGRVGAPLPRAPDDIHVFWRDWCTRGWFGWESDGYPFWSHLRVTQSWWNHRHLPNVLLLHYADMKADTGGAVRRIARFLEIERSEAELDAVTAEVSFENMRARSDIYAPNKGASWQGGGKTFLYKGTNGRWRDVLSQDELALYDAACARELTPGCREWLENGGAV